MRAAHKNALSGPTSTVGSAEASSFGPRPAPRKVFFAAYTPPQKTDWIFFAALRRRELCETFYKLTSLRILRRLVQYQARLGEVKPRQVARYKCFAEGKTLAGLHIAAIEAVICSGNRFSLTQQSTGLLLPASTPLRVCEVRSSFRFPPQALLQKIRDAIRRLLFFGAGYGNRTRLLGLGSRCTTDVLTLQNI